MCPGKEERERTHPNALLSLRLKGILISVALGNTFRRSASVQSVGRPAMYSFMGSNFSRKKEEKLVL